MYSCVASAGQAEDYQAMLKLHEQADSHEEKERIARLAIFAHLLSYILTSVDNRSGLAAFSDKVLLSQALHFSIGSCVRSQDSVHLIGSIAKNRAGRDISWQFFKDNFQLLKGRWGRCPVWYNFEIRS